MTPTAEEPIMDRLKEKSAAAIDEELGRQARDCVSMPYVGELTDGELIIDGTIEIGPLAAAVLALPEIKEALEDIRRRQALSDLTRLNEEMGLYDDSTNTRQD
jgi:hypothetical protein